MRTAAALCVVAAALAVGQFVAVGKVPGQPDQPKGKAERAPSQGKRAQEFIAAFEAGDAKALAGFWTPDGDYVDETGKQYKGRAAIEKVYEQAFAGGKGAKLAVTVTSARMVGSDLAIEDGLTEVTPPQGGPPTVARFSAVLVRKDGVWYFESVRESVALPPSHAEHFADLEWLIGDWVGEEPKGESATLSYELAENQNFIVCEFTTTLGGEPVVGGTQWIAWDAVQKRVRSWSFYSGGGFGEGSWTKDGGKWAIKTMAQTADGRRVSVTNLITRVDDDHLVWQATQLTADGTAMPDAPPVKLKRVKATAP
jgi:uncharacterized protein (TIGR02246 family)